MIVWAIATLFLSYGLNMTREVRSNGATYVPQQHQSSHCEAPDAA